MIKLRRVYEKPSRQDGLRILVERLWPRGVKKDDAAIDLWLKDLAPGTGLRKWFAHDPDKWDEFRRRYAKELSERQDLLTLLAYRATEGNVTLVYAARDEEHNSARALADILRRSSSM